MASARENTLKSDIEQACINSFIPSNNLQWTVVVTPQLQRFAQYIRDAIVRYSSTPSYVFSGVVPPTNAVPSGQRQMTLQHNLGYRPFSSLIEKEVVVNFVPTFQTSWTGMTLRPEIVEINTTSVIVYANVGDVIRVTLW